MAPVALVWLFVFVGLHPNLSAVFIMFIDLE